MNKQRSFHFIILILFFIPLQVAFSQNKLNVKKYKIKSTTEYDFKSSKNIIDSKTVYDLNGEVIEEYSYNKVGKLKSGHKYKRKADGDIIEEIEIGENGKVKEKRVVKHNENGEKQEEFFYDINNKLTKRHLYVYDAKGLRIERKTFDEKGKLKSMKKFVYEYN